MGARGHSGRACDQADDNVADDSVKCALPHSSIQHQTGEGFFDDAPGREGTHWPLLSMWHSDGWRAEQETSSNPQWRLVSPRSSAAWVLPHTYIYNRASRWRETTFLKRQVAHDRTRTTPFVCLSVSICLYLPLLSLSLSARARSFSRAHVRMQEREGRALPVFTCRVHAGAAGELRELLGQRVPRVVAHLRGRIREHAGS